MDNKDSIQALKVDDLEVWSFAEDFSALEVVGLICGKSNHDLLTWTEKQPVYVRMNKAFNKSKRQMEEAYIDADLSFDGDFFIEIPDRDPMNLHSFVNEKARLCPTDDACAWAGIEEFEDAKFGRSEIHRWLQAINATSKYAFALQGQTPNSAVDDEKPLVTRERNTLLVMIGLLCELAGHDLTKPAKTAVSIRNAAALRGIDIGETTIEEHLKKVNKSLEGKTK